MEYPAFQVCEGVARDVAKVATGVGLVVVESARELLRFQALGHCLKYFNGTDSRVADYASAETKFQKSRGSEGAMEDLAGGGTQRTEQQSGIRRGGALVSQQQPEELFTPKKAEESREARPFVSVEADAHVPPLSQTVSLPSVDAHLPPPGTQ